MSPLPFDKLKKAEKFERTNLDAQRAKFQNRIRRKNFMSSPLVWLFILACVGYAVWFISTH
jgi:hypothetical protein